jgi:hypothetical protein
MLGAITPSVLGADPAGPVHGKTALVLHSYYKGYRWTDDENRGIDSGLLPALGASNIYIEYMDTKRFFGGESLEQFPEVYRRRFMSHHFDVIVATDNNAFRLPAPPSRPVVPRHAGVSEEAVVQDTLKPALHLHPQTEHIYVVNEMTETGQAVHDEVRKWTASHCGRVALDFLEDYSMPDLLTALRKLPPKSLVFFGLIMQAAPAIELVPFVDHPAAEEPAL